MFRRQTGLSLIEALIAVLVASFGILGLARFQGDLFAGQALASQRTAAQVVARDKLDTLVALANPASAADGEDTLAQPAAALERSWHVALTAAGDASVTTHTDWTDSRGRTNRATLATLATLGAAASQARLLAAHTPLPDAAGMPGSALSGEPPWRPTVASVPGDGGTPPADTPAPPPNGADAPAGSHVVSGVLALFGKASAGRVSVSGNASAVCSRQGAAYACTVPHGWSGTVSVSSTGNQTVTPASRSYQNVLADLGGQDYLVSK